MDENESQPDPKKTVRLRKGGSKYDWEAMRRMYVEGIPEDLDDPEGDRKYVTLSEVAKKFGVTDVRVRERSAKEHWQEARATYQSQMIRRRLSRRSMHMARESVEFDARTLSLAKEGMKVVAARIGEIGQRVEEFTEKTRIAKQRAALGDKTAAPILNSDLRSIFSAKELETLAKAGSMWHELGRKALGDDAVRVEHSGVGGTPIEVEVTPITAEMAKGDPDRLAAFLQAAQRAGVLSGQQGQMLAQAQLALVQGDEDEDVVEAEVLPMPGHEDDQP